MYGLMNEGSASDDVPVFLFGFGADAGPAVLFVGEEVSGTLDISNHICSSGFKGS